MQKGKYLNDVLRRRMAEDGKRFWAGDNISDYVRDTDIPFLIDEATEAFELVLDRLLIDRETDPNSQGTARRLAKMYFTEIMAGRYEAAPDCTAFPNDSANRYEGMLHHPIAQRFPTTAKIAMTECLWCAVKYDRCAVIIISLSWVLPTSVYWLLIS